MTCGESASSRTNGGKARVLRRRPSASTAAATKATSFSSTSMMVVVRRAAFLLLVAAPLARAATGLSGWRSGILTNYGGPFDGKNPNEPSWGTSVGSCGFGMLDKGAWPYWSVAALSTENSFFKAGPLNGCGQCFEVRCVDLDGPWKGRCITGPNQVSVIVQITDSCPECGADHLDMQALTFHKLAPMEVGRVNIEYRRVECVPPKKMVVYVDQAHGQDKWLRLFVEQAGGKAEVKQVQIRPSGGSAAWIDLTNKWGSAWEISKAPPYPLDVNIVGAEGDTVTSYGVLASAGQLGKMPTNVQFKITNPADSALINSVSGSGSAGQSSSSSPSSSSSSSPAPSPSSNSNSGGGGGGDCDDVPASTFWSCADQKKWGQCEQWWMKAGGKGANGSNAPKGFCRKTCGACSGGGGGGGGVQTGGRRLAGATTTTTTEAV